MDHRKCRARVHGYGKLPSPAPLANPYVPYQNEEPPKYPDRKALIRGTLYPGLDLPFHGMVNNREKAETPKSQLQTLGFVLQELALYLDTHPEDMDALKCYRQYQQQYHDAMMRYGECTPINHVTPNRDATYTWLQDPWPWEYAANMEG